MRSKLAIAGTALMALAVGGCGSLNSMSDTFKSDAGWFSKPVSSLLTREDGSGSASANKNFSLGPTGPVAPEDLVNPDGSCAAAAPDTAATASPAAAPQVAPAAGDPAGGAMPAALPDVPLGGVALGMPECQVVRRAGAPSNVAIASENSERKAVLTYTGGQWPGVYTFVSGRLKVVDALPEAQKPKPVAKRKPAPKRGPTRVN